MVVVVDDVVVAFGTAVFDVGEVVAVGCEDAVFGAAVVVTAMVVRVGWEAAVVDAAAVVVVGWEAAVVDAVAAVSEVAFCRSSSSSIFFCNASISELVELPQPLAAKANITRSWSARTTQLCNIGRQLR